MLRRQVNQLVRTNTVFINRCFSMSAVRAKEGDTGATRFAGGSAGDAWSNREKAAENKFIRDKEMESLRKLREKLEMQKKHFAELESHVKALEDRQGGGEQH